MRYNNKQSSLNIHCPNALLVTENNLAFARYKKQYKQVEELGKLL